MIGTDQPEVAVFLLAENRLLREALSRTLVKMGGVRLVGMASPSLEAVAEIVANETDVLLLDSLTFAVGEQGLLSQLRRLAPHLKAVLFGMDEDPEKFLFAVQHGILGYILKEASARELANTIRLVANNEAFCPPCLCRTIFDLLARQAAGQVPVLRLKQKLGLSRREQQLVPMLADGLTNKEIAAKLNLSEQTIKNHVRNMLHKGGVSDRVQFVECCRERGFCA